MAGFPMIAQVNCSAICRRLGDTDRLVLSLMSPSLRAVSLARTGYRKGGDAQGPEEDGRHRFGAAPCVDQAQDGEGRGLQVGFHARHAAGQRGVRA